jgi:Domain of unknown function (DUF4158)
MDRMPLSLDELVEHWTVLDDERELIAGKRGPTRLGFALLLKFFTRHGRFPAGRSELPDEAIEFVARQVKIPASGLGFYEWSGRTTEYHRSQVREHLGFRECSVADADKLTDWLAAHVAKAERNPDRVREELARRCRAERIEPPAPARVTRIVRSALHSAEEAWFTVIAARAGTEASARVIALVDDDGMDDGGDDENQDSVLALVKSVPGNVSLNSMLTEIRKLEAIRAVGLPRGLFADVAPKVVSAWRARAAVESPSHLRRRLARRRAASRRIDQPDARGMARGMASSMLLAAPVRLAVVVRGRWHTALMKPLTLTDVETAIRASFGIDTYPHDSPNRWPADNPSRGQCGVTALVVNDLLGGQQ